MLPLAKPRLIHFYVWWHKDKPIYVGQAADVEFRTWQHLRSKGSFGKFLRRHKGSCFSEMLDTHILDVPQGPRAVQIENQYIDYYRTLWPLGFNMRHAGQKGAVNGGHIGGIMVHQLHPGHAQRSGRLGALATLRWAKKHQKEAHEIRSRSGRAGGKATQQRYPNLAASLGRTYGSLGGIKNGGRGMRTMRERYPQWREWAHRGNVERGRRGGRNSCKNMTAELHAKKVKAARLGGLAGGKFGGRRGMHARWHVRRGIKNQNCKLCVEPS